MPSAIPGDRDRCVRATGSADQDAIIGMTWEHDLHLYMKRGRASEAAFGDATWHRERVAALLGA